MNFVRGRVHHCAPEEWAGCGLCGRRVAGTPEEFEALYASMAFEVRVESAGLEDNWRDFCGEA